MRDQFLAMAALPTKNERLYLRDDMDVSEKRKISYCART
jgi:hypothetical protein